MHITKPGSSAYTQVYTGVGNSGHYGPRESERLRLKRH